MHLLAALRAALVVAVVEAGKQQAKKAAKKAAAQPPPASDEPGLSPAHVLVLIVVAALAVYLYSASTGEVASVGRVAMRRASAALHRKPVASKRPVGINKISTSASSGSPSEGSSGATSPRSPMYRSDTLRKKMESMGATPPAEEYEAVHSWSSGGVVMRKKSVAPADDGDLSELSHNVTL